MQRQRHSKGPIPLRSFWTLGLFFVILITIESGKSQHYTNACRSVNGKIGTCVDLPFCPLFMNFLKVRPLVKENIRMLINFTCYFDIKNPKVCCPNDNLYPPPPPSISPGSEYDPIGIRLGSPIRRGIQSENNKLHFPTYSIAFPSVSEAKPPPSKPQPLRQNVPLSFPSDSHFDHWKPTKNNIDNKGKSLISSSHNDLRLHHNFKLIPQLKDCSNAVKLDSLIGTYGAYPWLALVGIKPGRNSLDFEHFCGGAIINDRYVISSAHCLKSKRTRPKYVRLGEYDLDTLIDQGNEFLPQSRREDYRIEKFTIHPDYNPAMNSHDIALIRVDRPIALNATFIKAICLPFFTEYSIENKLNSHKKDLLDDLEGKAGWVAGWSRHSWDGILSRGSGSNILQESIVEFTSHEKCRQDYPQISALSSKSQLCVGGKGKRNSCAVDSGGPLMYPIKVPSRVPQFDEPKFFMLGLLSEGPTGNLCQNPAPEESNDPGHRHLPTSVYTRLSKYLKWILDNLHE